MGDAGNRLRVLVKEGTPMKYAIKKIALAVGICGAVSVTAHAQNLITNPAFSAGNTGFTSAYTFVTSNFAVQEYGVVTNPQAWNGNLASFGDHTTGTGSMLIANGATTANLDVWRQIGLAVTPATDYVFSGYVAAAFGSSAPVMEFFAGATSLGAVTPSLTTGTWSFFTGTWNSGANTSVTLRIVDNNLDFNGNDVVIDDLSFAVAVPEANTAALLALVGIPALGFLRRRHAGK